jgi:hypothetical protein
MADPTPAAPADAYAGSQDAIERQKNALVQILGEQGVYGQKQLQARQASAAALASAPTPSQQAGAPVTQDPTQRAMYDAFTKDAQSNIASDAQEQARIQQANMAYMDQVKGAIPLQQADLQSYTDSQRMAYEDRQKQRDAELAAQQAAAARAAASSAAANDPNKIYETLKAKIDAQNKIDAEQWDKMPIEQRTASAAGQLGKGGNKLTIDSAMAALGMDVAGPRSHESPNDPYWDAGHPGKVQTDAKTITPMMTSFFQDMLAGDKTWGEVVSTAHSFTPDNFSQYGVDMANIDPKSIGVWLAMYAPSFGVDPATLRG